MYVLHTHICIYAYIKLINTDGQRKYDDKLVKVSIILNILYQCTHQHELATYRFSEEKAENITLGEEKRN